VFRSQEPSGALEGLLLPDNLTMPNRELLLVEDDVTQSEVLAELLQSAGFALDSVQTCRGARARLERNTYDAILSDQNLPDGEGLEILAHARRLHTDIPFFVLTGDPSISRAVKAIQTGVTDYFSKPFDDCELVRRLSQSIEQTRSRRRQEILESQLRGSGGQTPLIGESPAIRQLRSEIETVALARSTVLILGESGTGKTLSARAIHEQSPRRHAPFVEVDCGCLSESLLESELFGHVAGSFTGAHQNRAGKFLLADGGTIFLDEIGTASPNLQLRLLRVLQDRSFDPLGSSKTCRVDVRVILATNGNLAEMVRRGSFREDLYYRINVITLRQPALRERLSDIPALVGFHLHRICHEIGRPTPALSSEASLRLQQHDWPGNVRELVNVLERAVVLSRGPILLESNLPPELRQGADETANPPLAGLRRELLVPERQLIEQALTKHAWKRQAAARELGIDRTTLYKKMRKFGLGCRDQ
jgi:DNA-binding NtrC family response regulator